MKVVSIKIHNILGIEDFEITPKEINRFEGKNATCKTSTLEAIKAALRGGHDATLLRNGADEGQVVILLDDGLEIKKTITGEKTDLSVKYPRSGVKVDKPQTHLNALTDALSVNPVEFLNAPAAKRAEYLLQAMPLKVTAEDLKGIYDYVPGKDEHAFTVLAAIEKLIYDERTGVNRLKDEKRKTAKQLGETLPLEDPNAPEPDWAKTVKDTTQALADSRSDLKNAREAAERKNKENRVAIDGACREAISAADRVYDAEKGRLEGVRKDAAVEAEKAGSALEAEYKKRLSELNEWRRAEQEKIDGDLSGRQKQVDDGMNAAKSARDAAVLVAKDSEKKSIEDEEVRFRADLDERTTGTQALIMNLTKGLAEAEEKAKRQVKDNATKDTIRRVLNEAEKHEEESNNLTARLEALQALRLRILSNLPIPGVTVEDGQVMRDGVPYDRLNTASQIEIAVAIAKIRAKDLGIVCVDGLECLDDENFAAFEKAMTGSGLQCFITRVTNTPMEVTVK